jgi:IS5 family transposase
MKQISLGLNLSTKKTRKREFLEQMEKVVPWAVLVQIVAPHYPKSKTGRPPFPIETMLRIHYMQQWFGLSDPAMEEALHDMPLLREFAKLDGVLDRLPDETTILRFRHLLERHDLAPDMLRVVNDLLQHKGLLLKTGTAVDATLISAPSSTKNSSGERDPEMKQSKKGNQWYFGMKAHIGVDAESGLVHTVRGTSGNVNDVVVANDLLHGEESVVFADSGYRDAQKRPDAKPDVSWQIARRRARVPCHQAAVRAYESALPRTRQEHSTTAHAVCADEPVDGSKTVDGTGWKSAFAAHESGVKRGREALRGSSTAMQ